MKKAIFCVLIAALLTLSACSKTTDVTNSGDSIVTSAVEKNASYPKFKGVYYANPRFGYSIAYSDIFTSGTESDNGDGIKFTSDDADLAIWGMNNADSQIFSDTLKNTLTIYQKTKMVLNSDTFFSFTFEKDGKCGYYYQAISSDSSKWIGFELTYPAEKKAMFENYADKMQNSFHFVQSNISDTDATTQK